jgi:hypothetical protein
MTQTTATHSPWSTDERRLCARLGGMSVQLDEGLIAAARSHGVHLLLAGKLNGEERASHPGLDLVRGLRVAAALQSCRDQVLIDLLGALERADVAPLVLKGAALSHRIYEQPWLRPHADIDLLIQRDARERCEQVLIGEGWSRDPESNAELASTQRHYSKTPAAGRTAYLDLHWKVANSPVFADALTYAELSARAVPVDALGPAARTPCDADALFLACIHIAAHHAEEPRLVWLIDVRCLAERLTPSGQEQFLVLTEQRAMRTICRHVLGLAADCFESARVTALAGRLAVDGVSEPSSRLLLPLSRAGRVRADLAALPSWRDRTRLIAEHLFPSFGYLQTRYPRCPKALLPVAALHRIVAGAPKWLRPSALRGDSTNSSSAGP